MSRRTHRQIDPEEEFGLVTRYQGGDNAAGARLLEVHSGFLRTMVRPYERAGLEFDDAEQEARLGFLEAVRRFDVAHGVKLITYAGWWVRDALQRATRETVRLVRLPRQANDAMVAAHRLGEDLAPSALVHAGRMKNEATAVAASSVWSKRPISLDAHADGNHRDTVGERLPTSSPSPEEEVAEAEEHAQARQTAADLLATLPPGLAREVIRRRWLVEEPETLQDIATTHGCTREWVRQVEEKTMAKLRLRAGARAAERRP